MSGGPYRDSNLKETLGDLVRRFDEVERKIGGMSPEEIKASLVADGIYDLPEDTDTSRKAGYDEAMSREIPSIISTGGSDNIAAQLAAHRPKDDFTRNKIERYVPRGWSFSEDNV